MKQRSWNKDTVFLKYTSSNNLESTDLYAQLFKWINVCVIKYDNNFVCSANTPIFH